MRKLSILILILIGLGGVLLFVLNTKSIDQPVPQVSNQLPFDPKNSTFKIDNRTITLVNGVGESSIPKSESKIITRYFGNEIKHDLDDDERVDSLFLVTQDGGGSGTFYYVVAVLNTAGGYVGSDSYFLGDRIAPQSTNIDEGTTSNNTSRKGVVAINYAIRNPGEPMSTPPSLGKSVWLKLDPTTMQFGEVAQNFEGESN